MEVTPRTRKAQKKRSIILECCNGKIDSNIQTVKYGQVAEANNEGTFSPVMCMYNYIFKYLYIIFLRLYSSKREIAITQRRATSRVRKPSWNERSRSDGATIVRFMLYFMILIP